MGPFPARNDRDLDVVESPLLKLKYNNAIADAFTELARSNEVRGGVRGIPAPSVPRRIFEALAKNSRPRSRLYPRKTVFGVKSIAISCNSKLSSLPLIPRFGSCTSLPQTSHLKFGTDHDWPAIGQHQIRGLPPGGFLPQQPGDQINYY